VSEFKYDSLNRRIALSQNGGQWRYDIHQGNIPVADVVTGVVQRVFVRGTGIAEGTGDVIAEIDRNGMVHYYLPNHRGDTVLCVTNNGVSVSYLKYDAFGNSVTNIGAFNPRYTFSTKEYLDDVKLYLYAYRLYDPVAGRWTQRDPVDYLDSVNLYQFCGNNPVNVMDSFGLLQKEYSKLYGGYIPKVIINRNLIGKKADLEVPGFKSLVPIFLVANDGTYIIAGMTTPDMRQKDWKNLKSNCHGYTFAGGLYVINDSVVKDILEHDKYNERKSGETPEVGDVAIYVNKNHDVVHSAKVTGVEVDESGNTVITVKGKSGIHAPKQSKAEDNYHEYHKIGYFYR
jgi:RHS repeat-associated protein